VKISDVQISDEEKCAFEEINTQIVAIQNALQAKLEGRFAYQ
jgi:hypothetical protein